MAANSSISVTAYSSSARDVSAASRGSDAMLSNSA